MSNLYYIGQGNQSIWSGLTAYYRMNSTGGTTLIDSSINGYNGTVSNAAIWNASGKKNGCTNNNGLYAATIPYATANNFLTTQKLSYSFWHYLTGNTYQGFIIQYGANGQRVFSFADESYYSPYHFYRLILGNTSGSWVYTSSDAANEAQTVYNAWAHVVFSIDCAATTFKIYVNGILKREVTNTGAIGFKTDTTTDLKFGNDATYFVKGRMDEVAVWNRVLSAKEVQDLYNMGNGIYY